MFDVTEYSCMHGYVVFRRNFYIWSVFFESKGNRSIRTKETQKMQFCPERVGVKLRVLFYISTMAYSKKN